MDPKILSNIKTNITNDICIIDIGTQTMLVQCENGFKKQYAISTATTGVGNESDSYKTPLGKHSICEKIGEFAPRYTIFKSRKNIGIKCEKLNVPIDLDSEDLILTRILRLKGEEPGVNSGYTIDGKCVDSYERYIYIHGTNREDLIQRSQPSSNGCIRMGNADIEELFLNIKLGAMVDIR